MRGHKCLKTDCSLNQRRRAYKKWFRSGFSKLPPYCHPKAHWEGIRGIYWELSTASVSEALGRLQPSQNDFRPLWCPLRRSSGVMPLVLRARRAHGSSVRAVPSGEAFGFFSTSLPNKVKGSGIPLCSPWLSVIALLKRALISTEQMENSCPDASVGQEYSHPSPLLSYFCSSRKLKPILPSTVSIAWSIFTGS